jgi:hypothetical protein
MKWRGEIVPDLIGQALHGKRGPTGKLPDTEMLCGYLAPLDDSDPDTRTLYLDPTGARCCFIPKDKIVHSHPIEGPASPLGLGGTAVFVPSDCTLSVQTNETVRADQQATFLQGGISDGALGQAPAGSRFIGEIPGNISLPEVWGVDPKWASAHSIGPFCQSVDWPPEFIA